jgi:lactoylglutathione lyase
MQIEHIAIWTRDLERLKAFYETYFQAKAGNKYQNSKRQYQSYFLSFASGARLEIMEAPDILPSPYPAGEQGCGYIHLAYSTGSETAVNELTEWLRQDGYGVAGEARRTGDGYYESVVLDPDGNRIEITV